MNFSDILLIPQKCIVPSRAECDISVQLGNHRFASPVVCANMKSLLTPSICQLFDENQWFYVYHRIGGDEDIYDFVLDAQDNFSVVSISVGLDSQELLERIAKQRCRLDYVTVDIAHSHTGRIIPTLYMIKHLFPHVFTIVGNGCTAEWIAFLENRQTDNKYLVDAAKIGIGVSNACRTRQYTGFGSQTASSLIECSKVAKRIQLISDGGLTVINGEVWIGDVAKAICLGADMVMSGSLFSRCIDSPAIVDGYYGNASRDAKGHSNHIEGTTLKIETNGLKIVEMMDLISDSLKSSVSYGGGGKLADLRKVKYNIIK
jgi:GMP reductase